MQYAIVTKVELTAVF